MYGMGLMPLNEYIWKYVPTVGQKTVSIFGYFGKIELEQIEKIK